MVGCSVGLRLLSLRDIQGLAAAGPITASITTLPVHIFNFMEGYIATCKLSPDKSIRALQDCKDRMAEQRALHTSEALLPPGRPAEYPKARAGTQNISSSTPSHSILDESTFS